MAEDRYEHLGLRLVRTGLAKPGNAPRPSERTNTNRTNPADYAKQIREVVAGVVKEQRWVEQARPAHAPKLPAGTQLLLEIDDYDGVEFLRTAFGFEVLAEHDAGFVLVAAQDTDLTKVSECLDLFEQGKRGGGSAARLYNIGGASTQDRLARVLSEALLEQWPKLNDTTPYVIDVSVACAGDVAIPREPTRTENDDDERWGAKLDRHAERVARAFRAWDELRDARQKELLAIVEAHQGEVLDVEAEDLAHLPDSFTIRMRISGDGLRDIAINYPYVFELDLAEKLAAPLDGTTQGGDAAAYSLKPPATDAPHICIIDSGIQAGHVLLAGAIAPNGARCFIRGKQDDDTADEVRSGGHGTRVAGRVLYPDLVGDPANANSEAVAWLRNARVLDRDCLVPEATNPALLLQRVFGWATALVPQPRIFVHSINEGIPCRTQRMAEWPARIDQASYDHDLLFIQSTGNVLPSSNVSSRPGVAQHLEAQRPYPRYLLEPASRLASPSQALHAITVGSVASRVLETPQWRTLGLGPGHVSAFSRTGLGLWGTVKPDVVEEAGDFGVDRSTPASVSTPLALRDAYPELVRSTLHGPGPAFDRDAVGTSFAAPKTAHLAALLARRFPSAPALLYRTMIVHSARWPDWSTRLSSAQRFETLRSIGYGIPDPSRALTSTSQRVTLITPESVKIAAKQCHVYQIDLPTDMLSSTEEFDVLLEVTMAYVAPVRRTRRTRRGYLGTWLDWISSDANEDKDSFLQRALSVGTGEVAGASERGEAINWTLGMRVDRGQLSDVSRTRGSIQKDWVALKSHELPRHFCIAVRGHAGWNLGPKSDIPYCLAVTIEARSPNVRLYERIAVPLSGVRGFPE